MLSEGALVAALLQDSASAGAANSVMIGTIKAATQVAAGKVVAANVLSTKVAALVERVLRLCC
jgi:hypothetical protein